MSAAGTAPSPGPSPAPGELARQVRSAVIWRSGTQIFSQVVAWASTFLVIRILSPADYGLFAMTSVVLVLLSLLNGYGFANAAIQQRDGGEQQLRQLFGLLLVINGALAAGQFFAAPWIAAYYRQSAVADLLRVQALIYLSTPFLALGYTVLSREMDFRRQAQVNVGSALIGAFTALGCALAGCGVWTLVFAPLASFTSRGLGMAIAARALVWPSFDFRGVRQLADYGGVVMIGQIFWFAQSQADIVIAVDAQPRGKPTVIPRSEVARIIWLHPELLSDDWQPPAEEPAAGWAVGLAKSAPATGLAELSETTVALGAGSFFLAMSCLGLTALAR